MLQVIGPILTTIYSFEINVHEEEEILLSNSIVRYASCKQIREFHRNGLM